MDNTLATTTSAVSGLTHVPLVIDSFWDCHIVASDEGLNPSYSIGNTES